MMLKRWILFSAITLWLPLHSDPIQVLDSFTDKALKEWKVPGAAVVVTHKDKLLFAKGYGVIESGKSASVDEDTIFQLASITKAFTAAGLGVQVDKGKLDWDHEVINYLPQFALKEPYPSRYTTTRDLLAHRTGLPAFAGDLLTKLGYDDSDMLRRVRFIEPASSFREEPHYSNLGYFIAGEALGAITGSNWEQAVQETILTPLKMDRSGFPELLERSNVAKGHAFIDGKLTVLKPDPTGGFPAAGAMCSTANDMGKWMIMLLTGGQKVLKPETIQAMFVSSMAGTPEFSEAPPISEYSGFDFGMGWDNFHYMNQLIVEKGGGLDGIRTVTTVVPQKQLGITVLCNLNLTLFPEAVRAKFLEEYLGKSDTDLQAEIKERQSTLDALLKMEQKPKNPIPHRKLDLYTGDFSNEVYGSFKVVKKNGDLAIEAGPAKYSGTLKHWSNDTFILTWPIVNLGHQEVTFTFGPEGKAIELQTETFGSFSQEEKKSQ